MRVSLRRVGSLTGKLALLPATMEELLALATQKLGLGAAASRVFSAGGDECDADDLELIEAGEVLYVSCGEDFSAPASSAAAATPKPAAAAEAPPAVVAETPPTAAASPAPLPEAAGGNPFDVFSPDDSVAAAAIERLTAAAPAAPISEQATREYVTAKPATLFSFIARGGGGAAAGKGGKPFYLKVLGSEAKDASPQLYAFCQNSSKYLEKRRAGPEGEAADALLQPLLMGEWERIKVPPDEIKKHKGAKMLGLKPALSGMKAVFDSRKRREGAITWLYPTDAELLALKFNWHDFKSVVTEVHDIFKKEEKEAEAAARKAAKPSNDDSGGLCKLGKDFRKAEDSRKAKLAEIESRWAEREAAISKRQKVASDVLERALGPADRDAAQATIDAVDEERRCFYSARSKESVELETTRLEAKRKYDGDVQRQKVYNKQVKGESRKKFQRGLAKGKAGKGKAQLQLDSEFDSESDSEDDEPADSASAAGPSSLVASAARARAPPASLLAYYEQERLASLIDASMSMLHLLSD